MNDLIAFDFDDDTVRVVMLGNDPWWVARDICTILGLGNVAMTLRKLDADQKGISQVDTPGGPQSLSTVSESGMWTLILRSDKPEAKRLRRWLTDHVLPSLRRTGAYQPEGRHVRAGQPLERLAEAIAGRACITVNEAITLADLALPDHSEAMAQCAAMLRAMGWRRVWAPPVEEAQTVVRLVPEAEPVQPEDEAEPTSIDDEGSNDG